MGEAMKTAKKAYNKTRQIDQDVKKRVKKAAPGEKVILNDKEATSYLLHNHHSPNVDYHNSKMEEKLGYDSVTYLTKNKNGRVSYHRTERAGGFFYIGSLISVVVLLVSTGSAIYGIYDTYTRADTMNMIISIILALILLISTILVVVKSLIPDIKEKLEYKKRIKEGTAQKRKLGFGMLTSRIMVIDLLFIMGISLCGLINQSIGKDDTQLFVITFMFAAAIFMITGVVKTIYSVAAMFISLKKDVDSIRRADTRQE